jgi:hypothetical protein
VRTSEIHDQIVWGYVERVSAERDPVRRHALRAELVEEEDRLGVASERLDRAEAHIADGQFRIEALEGTIASLRGKGADVRVAERVLTNLREILATFDEYRTVLLDGLDRNKI